VLGKSATANECAVVAATRPGRANAAWMRGFEVVETTGVCHFMRAMHPLVKAAASVAVLTALGSLDRGPKPRPAPITAPAAARGVDGLPALCGPGTLPEGPVCVRIPVEGAAKEASRSVNDVGRSGTAGERVPRRPDRPEEAARYRYPVGLGERAPKVLGAFEGERGGHGVEIAAKPAERVTLVALEGQEGPAEVVFAGERGGALVVATRHDVREGSELRSYLLIHGDLERLEQGLAEGARLEAGAALGYAALTAGGHLITITLEGRQVRAGAALGTMDEKRLADGSVSVPIDLRNVLPLR
jgi:hypothetical protein